MLESAAETMQVLQRMGSPENRAGMARYGIRVENAFGVSVVELRKLARRVVRSRRLAEQLWATRNHEARLLAGYICPVESVDEGLAEAWVADFDSWGICDQVMDLFASSSLGWQKAVQWCGREEEFVRRTGFGMFAWFAVHDKAASNTKFIRTCLPQIRKHASDERNFVKKAVNWALRNIGKRNEALNARAVQVARSLAMRDSASARWIGRDAVVVMATWLSFGAVVRRSASLASSSARRRARSVRSPSASAWMRQAMRFHRKSLLPERDRSPKTSW